MRNYCSNCHYPLTTCICASVAQINSPIPCLILQHHKEIIHAKNTARLVSLVVDNVEISTFPTQCDDNVLNRCLEEASNPAVIYPSDNSVPIESLSNKKHHHDLLILLDGSWRQAYAMWQEHRQLHRLPQYHFTQSPESRYAIRHTKQEGGLSTLEATAYALAVLADVDPTPLYDVQQAMQAHWRGPDDHRRQ